MNFKPVNLATLVIFGTGVITGGLWLNHLRDARPRSPHHQSATGDHHSDNVRPPKILSRPFLKTLDQQLELTPDQHAAIQKIMSEGQEQMRKTVRDTRLEIREVLTPAERAKFDELVSRRFIRPLFNTNPPPSTNLVLP